MTVIAVSCVSCLRLNTVLPVRVRFPLLPVVVFRVLLAAAEASAEPRPHSTAAQQP